MVAFTTAPQSIYIENTIKLSWGGGGGGGGGVVQEATCAIATATRKLLGIDRA